MQKLASGKPNVDIMSETCMQQLPYRDWNSNVLRVPRLRLIPYEIPLIIKGAVYELTHVAVLYSWRG
jgi:hypothetical protein